MNIFPVHYGWLKVMEWSGRKRFIYLKALEKNERRDRATLEQIQFGKLKKILWHAYINVPYYSELFKNLEITPDDIRSAEDLTHLPILTKEIIRNNFAKFKSINIAESNLIINHTGGSTGEPLSFFADRDLFEKMEAGFFRCLSWGGYRPGDHLAYIWGAPKDLKGLGSFKHRVKSFLNKKYYIGAYNYSPEEMEKWLNLLKKKRIKFIYGYASVLANFSNYIKKKNLENPKLKAIFTSAETLFPEARRSIEEVFNCKVYDQYGSREVISIASECERGNMHILTDFVHVEFSKEETIKTESPQCKVIVTSFINFGTPFIRYEIGDYATPKEGHCSCGRTFPLMEMNIGRMNEHVLTADGKFIYPSYFIHLLDGIDGIRSFQFRQIDFEHIELQIVLNEKSQMLEKKLQEVEKRIKKEVSSSISLSVNFVEAIPLTPAGKHRYVISDLS